MAQPEAEDLDEADKCRINKMHIGAAFAARNRAKRVYFTLRCNISLGCTHPCCDAHQMLCVGRTRIVRPTPVSALLVCSTVWMLRWWQLAIVMGGTVGRVITALRSALLRLRVLVTAHCS